MEFVVHDTLRRGKREFKPVTPGKVGIYGCGMTVQSQPHVGHMRAALVGDLIRRYISLKGYDVTFVSNFTDVDDKIIQVAAEEGISCEEVAERNIEEYFKYADLLNIKRADIYPKATEHIDEMVELISRLMEKGYAYQGGPDVYFDVGKFSEYGKLSGRNPEELRVGARIEPGEHKQSPLDFTLWKGAKPGEPAWKTPWGEGRPGWHIECSAMSMKYLGETFDLHGGGRDLVFPHHENEVAQSEAATGKPFVNYWVHNGMVNLTGEKMSKSTKHFFLIGDVCKEFDPKVVRLYLLSTHYRSPIEFSHERLSEALSRHERLVNTIELSEGVRPEAGTADSAPEVDTIIDDFYQAMDDDFNTARALASISDLSRLVHKFLEEGEKTRACIARDAMITLGEYLGLAFSPEQLDIPAEVLALAERRQKARKDTDWALADALRDQIESQGFVAEDTKEGVRVRRKKTD
jgi:cysteinyl-tRNA synthetase